MAKDECENWLINIENTSSTISSQVGSAVVDAVFRKYGAKDVDNSASSCFVPRLIV